MIRPETAFANELAAREAIRDCLHLYSRAIDRCDGELLRDVFWPDTMIDADGNPRTVDEFVNGSIRSLQANWERVHHLVTNILIRIGGSGECADVESYNHGYHCSTGQRRDLIIAGRYLDRFERRQGEWRIARRTVMVDWFRDHGASGDWTASPWVRSANKGTYGPQDPSYRLFGEI